MRFIEHQLNDLGIDRRRCLDVLTTAIAPLHNLYRVNQHEPPDFGVYVWGNGIMVKLKTNSLATFDLDQLTRLVVEAHARRCRVEIAPHSFNELRVCVHPRQTNGRTDERHPGLSDLIDRCRRRAYDQKP